MLKADMRELVERRLFECHSGFSYGDMSKVSDYHLLIMLIELEREQATNYALAEEADWRREYTD